MEAVAGEFAAILWEYSGNSLETAVSVRIILVWLS